MGLLRFHCLDACHTLGFLRQHPRYLRMDLLQGKELDLENSLANTFGYPGEPGKLRIRIDPAFQVKG